MGHVGSLNGAETLAIGLLEVMLCPKRDAPSEMCGLLEYNTVSKPNMTLHDY